MKKAIFLSILLLGLSCTLMARELDEIEVTLIDKVKQCQLEGEKLYNAAMTQESAPHLTQMYFTGAMKFFKLERKYLADLRWHRVVNKLMEHIDDDCCDDDCDWDAKINLGQKLLQLKNSQ